MKYAVVYSSRTGNTAMLAQKIREVMKDHACVWFGEPDEKALEADLVMVGFWTDKGTCDGTVDAFLQKLHGKKVYLFGTAGFGGAPAYFAKILASVKEKVPADNTLTGSYMCQGKMPMAVRRHYESMLDDPEKGAMMRKMIENFDEALSHPDQNDLGQLAENVKEAL